MNFEYRTIDQFLDQEGEVNANDREIKIELVAIVQTKSHIGGGTTEV